METPRSVLCHNQISKFSNMLFDKCLKLGFKMIIFILQDCDND